MEPSAEVDHLAVLLKPLLIHNIKWQISFEVLPAAVQSLSAVYYLSKIHNWQFLDCTSCTYLYTPFHTITGYFCCCFIPSNFTALAIKVSFCFQEKAHSNIKMTCDVLLIREAHQNIQYWSSGLNQNYQIVLIDLEYCLGTKLSKLGIQTIWGFRKYFIVWAYCNN